MKRLRSYEYVAVKREGEKEIDREKSMLTGVREQER